MFTKYVKIACFNGASLMPQPPVASKSQGVRYFHVYEDEQVDDAQLAAWIRLSSTLPGWKP